MAYLGPIQTSNVVFNGLDLTIQWFLDHNYAMADVLTASGESEMFDMPEYLERAINMYMKSQYKDQMTLQAFLDLTFGK